MYQVLVPCHPDNGILNPGAKPDPSKPPVYTRRGKLHHNLEAAKRLARRHAGKVVDLQTGARVADYLVW